MSKISNLIDYTFTGEYGIQRKQKYNYLDAKLNVSNNGDPYNGITRQFKLGVKLEKVAWVDDNQLIKTNENEPAIINDVLKDLKRAMIEEIFGEFRPMIIEMRAALYDRDDSRLRTLLAEMECSMFYDGPRNENNLR